MPDDYETVKTILCSGLSPHAVFGANKNSLLLRAAHYDAIESAKVLFRICSCKQRERFIFE